MNKRKLNYTFHNPNTAEATADYILNMLVDVNAKKVEEAIQKNAELEENQHCARKIHR